MYEIYFRQVMAKVSNVSFTNIVLYISFFYFTRVQCYINYGWDQHLVDPDKGANSRKKLAAAVAAAAAAESLPSRLLHPVPAADDTLWTSRLYRIPKITFSTIYDFLVDRKVLLRRVSYLEGIADKRAEIISTNCEQDKSKLMNKFHNKVL